MKELYAQDSNFQEAYEACKSPVQYDRGKWAYFMIQDGCYLGTTSYVFLNVQ